MGKYNGYIVSIKPASSVIVGDALMVEVKYHIETTAWFEKINGWASLVRVSSGDLKAQKYLSPMHFGASYDGKAVFNYGVMPAYDELFTVELRGYDAGFSFYNEVVDVRTRYVTALASPIPAIPTPTPSPGVPIPTPSPGVPIPTLPPPGPGLPSPTPSPDNEGGALPGWLLPVGIGLAAVILLMPTDKGES